ncbi:MAG: ANTAR domain-containing protein [Sporichthyaceae bacterium]
MTGRHGTPRTGVRGARESIDPGREQRLADTFTALADTLVESFDLVEFLYMLVERCVEFVDVSAVGLMFGDERGQLRVAASSSEETRLLELFQLQNNQGPCLECFRTGEPVEERDLTTAGERWPVFAPEAVAAGFRTVHAVPMRLREITVGSLNLFHRQPDALPTSATRLAQSLVDVATIGLIQVDRSRGREVLTRQLQAALDSRIVLEQAKGIVSELREITPVEALSVLREYARSQDVRLTALAHAVIDGDPLTTSLVAPDSTRIGRLR